MEFEAVKWKDTRKTPERFARKARPNLSESVLADPGRESRREKVDFLNILSGLPGAEVALGKGLVGLGGLGMIKGKGGYWLTGSVEGALKGLRRQGASTPEEAKIVLGDKSLVTPEVLEAMQQRNSLNQWIEGPLTKYVKTRMASPDDEVRKLAEQGVLHFEPAVIRERSPLMEKIVGRRETAGFPIQGIADAPLARNWENTSDSLIRNLEARDLSSAERAASFGGKSNIPGDTIVHEMNPFASGAGISDLGFPHLIDELSNALNPASGLPRNLQLTPEAVKQLSMEKAVRRVADINAWRAAQAAEANRALAEKATILRAYEDGAIPNPKGLRWVELKARPGDAPADFKTLFPGQTAEDAARAASNKELADQLEYEGKQMANCVGGYCDDVLAGRKRIMSLRDAKGQPHVTVEVNSYDPEDLAYNHDFWARPDVQEATRDLDPTSDEFNRVVDAIAKKDNPGARIAQIKYKGNSTKPVEDYLPFVQDFVRNSPLGGKWGEVRDLESSGLWNLRQAETNPTWTNVLHGDVPTHMVAHRTGVGNQFENPDAVLKALREAYPDADYLTADEYRKVFGFAQGGRVDSSGTETLGTRGYSEDAPEAAWPFTPPRTTEAAWPF